MPALVEKSSPCSLDALESGKKESVNLNNLPSKFQNDLFRFRPIETKNMQETLEVKQINEDSFPVSYDDNYYYEVSEGLRKFNPLYTNLCIYQNTIVAAITYQFTDFEEDVLLDAMSDNDGKEQCCYILTIAIKEKFRRFGIGKELIKQCLAHAKSNTRCKAIYLHVITYNAAAIKFYENLGFKNLKTLKDFYLIEKKFYDCFVYAFLLGNEDEVTRKKFGLVEKEKENETGTLFEKVRDSLSRLLDYLLKLRKSKM
eukprot:snap_masked-scaffold_10-processed-gene-4.20-mRNA-1 protein AED:0.26 eAED:1.00 QI:0/-1/0/1/-1/1/1/0/256